MKKYFVMTQSLSRLPAFFLCVALINLGIFACLADRAGAVRLADEGVTDKSSTTPEVAQPKPKTPPTPTTVAPAAPQKMPARPPEPKPVAAEQKSKEPARRVPVAPTTSQQPPPQQTEEVKTAPVAQMKKPEVEEKEKEIIEEERSVTIDFDNVDILLFVKFISEVTGKNFIIDQKVKGKVTIISPTKISVAEAYRVFLSVLEVHGFTTIEAGDIIKIVPSVVARGKSIETRLQAESIIPEDRVVTQLIRLKYANPDELKKLFAPLISKSSVIVSYAPSGMLIVTDVLSNIARLMNIIEAVDVIGVGEEISVIPLEHATASTLIKSLTTIFTAGRTTTSRKKGQSAVSPTIKMVADERTNALILSASEYDTDRIKALIKMLDQEVPRGMGNIRVHYLQYADAEELAKVLTALPTDETAKTAKGKAPVISKEVQIVADKATNSLVITTTKQDYLTLVEVIKKLDIPRSMVYIEALIMEVKATKEFEIGTEWRAGDDSIGNYEGKTYGAFAGSVPGSSSLPSSTSLSLPAGVSMGILGEAITIGGATFASLGAIARAYQSDTDVHILQTPQILTTDNEEAEIQVADNVPYLTKEASGDQEYQTYEYRDVGLKLKITPQINRDRFVRLKIFQEYSTISTGGDRPTTLKRAADTTVIVQDNQTVVIGGLVGDQISRGTTGVPCLANVPILGWAFKAYSRDQDKTNLFIFLTPHVIQAPEEAQKIFEEKKTDMDRIEEGVIKMYQKTNPPIAPKIIEEIEQ